MTLAYFVQDCRVGRALDTRQILVLLSEQFFDPTGRRES